MIKNKLFFFIFLLLFSEMYSQKELIPNGGFEDNCNHPNCGQCSFPDCGCLIPTFRGQLGNGMAPPWQDVGISSGGSASTADLFDKRWQCCKFSCSNDEAVGIPDNYLNRQDGIAQSNRTSASNRYGHLQGGPFGRNDGIGVQIKPLVAGKPYTLKFYIANKTKGNIFGNVPNVTIKVRVGPSNNWGQGVIQHNATIAGVGGNNDPWQEVTMQFTVNDCDIDWVMIRIEPPLFGQRHAFIDDISMIDPYCSECESDPDGTILSSITTNGLHNDSQPLTFFGLETVKQFNLKIHTSGGQTLIRNLVLTNPFNQYSWDGKNNLGATVADGSYEYELSVDNDCRCKILSDNFIKNGDYITNPNNPDPIKNASLLTFPPLTFNSLETAVNFNLIVRQGVTTLRTLTITNPQGIVAWDGKDNSGNILPPGNYTFSLSLSNKCNSKTLSGSFVMPGSYPHIHLITIIPQHLSPIHYFQLHIHVNVQIIVKIIIDRLSLVVPNR